MKILLIIPPNYPLIPKKETGNSNDKPNTHFPPPNFLLPYYLFFNPLDFIFIDYSLSVSKVCKTLNNAIIEINKKTFDTIIFDRILFENSDHYIQNVKNIISKIKIQNPNIKIGFITEKPQEEHCDFSVNLRNGNLIFPKNITIHNVNDKTRDILEIIKYSKKEEIEPLVVSNVINHKLFVEILKQEIFNFDIVNCEFDNKIVFEIKKIKKDYFDFEFYFNTDIKGILEKDITSLKGIGLTKLTCNLKTQDLSNINLERIKEINNNFKLQLEISPDYNNKQLLELIDFLDIEKINYEIKTTVPKIETKKEFKIFSFVSLLQALDKENTDLKIIKERIKQKIPLLKENVTFEQTLDFCINSEKKYLKFYLDIIHFLDGFFTKDEIIEYLKKLHPDTKKENIETIVSNCIYLLEKEMFIDYLNSENQTQELNSKKSHYISSLPRIDNLFLLYNGCEKGYIFSKGSNKIEEIPKDVFFFFVFSKGIYFLKEISSKLQLIFKDKQEYSKENCLKTTEKLYKTLKQYKLCK